MQDFILNNGLRVITKEDHRAPLVIFQIFYKVGSSYEKKGKTGISHALEHMMFRGTKLYESAEYFLKTIAGFGGQQNAHTAHDYTTYYEIMPAKKLSFCFKFEASRMSQLLLRSRDFAQEIKVVMEERRMLIEDDPDRLAIEEFNSIAFTKGPYHHPIIGWMADLKKLTIHDLRKWYQSWYSPNNAVIVVVGDIKRKEVERLSKKFFGKIKSRSLPAIKSPDKNPIIKSRSIILRSKKKLPSLMIGISVPTVITAANKWEPYALLCLGKILAEGNNSRLQKHLIFEKNLAFDISFHYSPFHLYDTLFVITMTPTPKTSIATLKAQVMSLFKVLKDKGISEAELVRTQTNIVSSTIYDTDSIAALALEIGQFYSLGLDWHARNESYQLVNELTVNEINQVAKQYLDNNQFIFAQVEPE